MNNNYSYTQLASKLSNKRQSIKIENNTYAFKHANLVISQDKSSQAHSIVITLYGNEIAELTPDKIRLTSSGWLTYTTKDRLNKILHCTPYRIYQEHGQWYIWNTTAGLNYAMHWIFADGVKFDYHGPHWEWSIDSDTIGKDNSNLRNSILKYVKGYITALKRGEIEEPSPKDCLYCQLFLGEGIESTDHLISHMDEQYYVPSLLYRAIREYPVSKYAFYLVQNWNDNPINEQDYWIIDSQVYSSLKRYMFWRLIRGKL